MRSGRTSTCSGRSCDDARQAIRSPAQRPKRAPRTRTRVRLGGSSPTEVRGARSTGWSSLRQGPPQGPDPHPRQPGPRLARLGRGAGVAARADGRRRGGGGLRRHRGTGREPRAGEGAPAPGGAAVAGGLRRLRPHRHGGHPAGAGKPLAARGPLPRRGHRPPPGAARDPAGRGRRRGARHRRHLHRGHRLPASERPRGPAVHRHRPLLRDQVGHPRPGAGDHRTGHRGLPLALPQGRQRRPSRRSSTRACPRTTSASSTPRSRRPGSTATR